MSIVNENNGTLEFMLGKKAFEAKDYNKAAEHFKKSAEEYTAAKNLVNMQSAYLNQGASSIAAGKPDEAIAPLEQARDAGLDSSELTRNFVSAYYNWGIKLKASGDVDGAIRCFTEVKKYDATYTDARYQLSITHMLKGEYVEAEQSFKDLLDEKIIESKFPIELQLNSFCKLIECKLAQNKEVNETTLKVASEIFARLPVGEHAQHKEEAIFVYNRLVAIYLAEKDAANAAGVLTAAESLIPGIAHDIAENLEEYALFKNKNHENALAMHMLLTLANALPADEIVHEIKKDLSDIANSLNVPTKSGDFSLAVLGDIATCTHDQIDDLFI